jgi:hypothetical protein
VVDGGRKWYVESGEEGLLGQIGRQVTFQHEVKGSDPDRDRMIASGEEAARERAKALRQILGRRRVRGEAAMEEELE